MSLPASSPRLTIGALSRRAACNVETIRYYERIGLMPHPRRSEGGYRLYGDDQVKRLGFIRRSRELGFTLDQIRTLLTLVDGRRYTCAQVRRVTVEHLDEVRRKVADLEKIARVLEDMAAQCAGGTVPACPVIDALFAPAPRAGARQVSHLSGPPVAASVRDRSSSIPTPAAAGAGISSRRSGPRRRTGRDGPGER